MIGIHSSIPDSGNSTTIITSALIFILFIIIIINIINVNVMNSTPVAHDECILIALSTIKCHTLFCDRVPFPAILCSYNGHNKAKPKYHGMKKQQMTKFGPNTDVSKSTFWWILFIMEWHGKPNGLLVDAVIQDHEFHPWLYHWDLWLYHFFQNFMNHNPV